MRSAFLSTLPFSLRLELSWRPDRDKLAFVIGDWAILGGTRSDLEDNTVVLAVASGLNDSSKSGRVFPL